jgi:hypothetical protein
MGEGKQRGYFGLFIYLFQFVLFFKTRNLDEVNSIYNQGQTPTSF